MSENALVFTTAIDLTGLDRDLVTARSMIDDSVTASAKISENSFGDGGGSMAASFVGFASKIRSSMTEAIRPITLFAVEFRSQFAEVGATVERLSIRIDDAMRFPQFIKRVDAFRRGLLSRFGLTMKEVGDQAQQGFNVQADASKFVGQFTKAREQVKKAVAPIPKDVGYAIEAAFHVDGKGSFKTLLAGLDEVRSVAIDRMKAIADAVQNATGKGSRTGRKRALGNAVQLASTQLASPPKDNTTTATKGSTRAWEMLGRTIKFVAEVEKTSSRIIGDLVRQDARDVDRLIAVWRKFEQLKSTISTFGSVANATFGKLGKLPGPKFTLDNRQSVVLKGIDRAAKSATGSMRSFADQASMALGLFGLGFKAVSFFKDGAKSASNLNETLSKTDVILGSGSPAVKQFADDMASRFGMVKGLTLDVASSFGGLGKSLGRMNGNQLAGFSTQFTKLAADLGSFENIDVSEAADALRTGLSGNQSDLLKKLGVVLTENTVKAYAYSHGLATVGTELTEQAKFMSRSALIASGLAKVNGDLERTSGGAANQGRKLSGSIQNIGTMIGSAMLPTITEGITLLNEFASWGMKTFEENKAIVSGWASSLMDSFDYVVAVVHNFPAAFDVARLKIYESLTNIGEWIAVLGPNATKTAEYIGKNWLLLIGDAFDGTVTGLKNLWSNFQSIGEAIGQWFADPTKGFKVNWTPLLTGFKATAEKFPELLKPALTDMSKEIAVASRPLLDEVNARRAKRALGTPAIARMEEAMPELANAKEGPGRSKVKEATEVKFSGALELGSKEAYSSIIAATSGRSKGMDAIEQSGRATAGNTAELVRLQAAQNRQQNQREKMVIF